MNLGHQDWNRTLKLRTLIQVQEEWELLEEAVLSMRNDTGQVLLQLCGDSVTTLRGNKVMDSPPTDILSP